MVPVGVIHEMTMIDPKKCSTVLLVYKMHINRSQQPTASFIVVFNISIKKHIYSINFLQNNRNFFTMNYLMFQQSGEGQLKGGIKVPDGLKQLMTDISREVLREQPENIYEFIADYLEEMELAREHKGSNEQCINRFNQIHFAKLTFEILCVVAENILNMVIDESLTVYELFKESGISMENAKTSAKIIENSFKEYKRNKNTNAGDQQQSSKAMEKILERDVCRKIMQSCDLTREQDQNLRKIVQMCFKSFYFREKSYKLKVTFTTSI